MEMHIIRNLNTCTSLWYICNQAVPIRENCFINRIIRRGNTLQVSLNKTISGKRDEKRIMGGQGGGERKKKEREGVGEGGMGE